MVLELSPRAEIAKSEYQDKIKFGVSQLTTVGHPPLEYGDDDANQLQYLELYKHRLKILKPRLIRFLKKKYNF